MSDFMLERRKQTLAAAAATLLLLLCAGHAQAQGECLMARNSCQREASESLRLCRAECGTDFRPIIARLRASCREQGLTHAECRDLAVEESSSNGAQCASECRPEFREAIRACREEGRECRESMTGSRDEACVAACREAFAPCHEEQRSCHEACLVGSRKIADACFDSDLEPRLQRRCALEARMSIPECTLGCRDAHACHAGLRACVSECPFVDDPGTN